MNALIKLVSFNPDDRMMPKELYLNLLEAREFKIDAIE